MADRRTKDVLLQAGSVVTAFRPLRSALLRAIQAGRVPRSVWSRIPVQTAFDVSISDHERFEYGVTATDTMGRYLFWRGLDGYEPESTGVFTALARSARGVVDVGAHTGLYTLLACAANPAVSVVAFEPVPRIAKVLRDNVERNGWSSRCTVFENPVAEADQLMPFHVPASATPMSASLDPAGLRIGDSDPAWQHSGGVVATAYARAIDSCLDEDTPVDLIKIDVEGFEDRVIRGASRTLGTWSPALIFEVLDAVDHVQIETHLQDFGYGYYKLSASGPSPVDTLQPPTDSNYRNYLAVRRTDHRQIADSLVASG